MTVIAMQVAQALEKEGVSVEVVDLRSLRPLDRPTLVNSVKKTGRAVIIEEDWRSYGVGAELAATIQEEAFDYLDAPVLRVAGLEVPLPYAEQLSRASKPNAQDLKDAIYRVLEGGKRWRK
jgi:pyruvate dehydrogenase E1 component beta subunit